MSGDCGEEDAALKKSPSKVLTPSKDDSSSQVAVAAETTPEAVAKPPFTPAQILENEARRTPARPAEVCLYCQRPEQSNPHGVASDKFLTCADCGSSAHAQQCLNYRPELVEHIRRRRVMWHCIECKRCAVCLQTCETLLLCDRCDRSFHKECCDPPLRSIPNIDWICHVCKWEDEEDKGQTACVTKSKQGKCAEHKSDNDGGVDDADQLKKPNKKAQRKEKVQKSKLANVNDVSVPNSPAPEQKKTDISSK